MNEEQHIAPRIWDPLGFFRDFQYSGLLVFSLFALTVIAVAAFVTLLVRRRITHFFALPLFLSLVPFVVCSLISYLRFYTVLGSLPPGSSVDGAIADAVASIQYPLQFGMLSSGTLLLLHACAYAFLRNTRNA